jgi:hypothetical protein
MHPGIRCRIIVRTPDRVLEGASAQMSADTRTYLVTSSTDVDAQRAGIASVAAGHQASLVATVSGGTATATSIDDLTLLPPRPSSGYPGRASLPEPPQASGARPA